MESASTPESTGLSEAQATEKLEALLDPSRAVHSEGDETKAGQDPPTLDDSEPDEDELEDEDQSELEDEDPPSAEEPEDASLVTVKVGDEEQTVTLHELKRGFLREQDYTRKTQAVAERAKALDAERAAFAPLAERTKALLDHLEQAYRAPLYDEAELASLRFTDPSEWAARMLEVEQRQRQVDAILGQKAELAAYDEAEKQRQAQSHSESLALKRQEEDAKLLEQRPEWKDQAVWKRDAANVIKLAQTLALSEDEWESVTTDHRMFLVLDEAAKYRALKAKEPQIRERVEKVKTARPGTATAPVSKVTEVTRAKQRLAKTGRMEDAASAIERLL